MLLNKAQKKDVSGDDFYNVSTKRHTVSLNMSCFITRTASEFFAYDIFLLLLSLLSFRLFSASVISQTTPIVSPFICSITFVIWLTLYLIQEIWSISHLSMCGRRSFVFVFANVWLNQMMNAENCVETI